MKSKFWCLCKVLLAFSIIGCNSTNRLPKERLYQFKTGSKIRISNDSLIVFLNNPVHSPLRFLLGSKDSKLADLLPKGWIQLQSFQDSTIIIRDSAFAKAQQRDIYYSANLGDPDLNIIPHVISLPIDKNRRVKIMQGYNGSFSHQKVTSRYAIDFDMQIGDTIYAADAGRVVGVIKDYKHGGPDAKWTPFANFITVYNNESRWFTQYVHLKSAGSLVQVGDTVRPGDPIGIVGMTGYTTKAHLHFNVFKTTDEGNNLESLPVEFKDYGNGRNLKKGSVVQRR